MQIAIIVPFPLNPVTSVLRTYTFGVFNIIKYNALTLFWLELIKPFRSGFKLDRGIGKARETTDG